MLPPIDSLTRSKVTIPVKNSSLIVAVIDVLLLLLMYLFYSKWINLVLFVVSARVLFHFESVTDYVFSTRYSSERSWFFDYICINVRLNIMLTTFRLAFQEMIPCIMNHSLVP